MRHHKFVAANCVVTSQRDSKENNGVIRSWQAAEQHPNMSCTRVTAFTILHQKMVAAWFRAVNGCPIKVVESCEDKQDRKEGGSSRYKECSTAGQQQQPRNKRRVTHAHLGDQRRRKRRGRSYDIHAISHRQ